MKWLIKSIRHTEVPLEAQEYSFSPTFLHFDACLCHLMHALLNVWSPNPPSLLPGIHVQKSGPFFVILLIKLRKWNQSNSVEERRQGPKRSVIARTGSGQWKHGPCRVWAAEGPGGSQGLLQAHKQDCVEAQSGFHVIENSKDAPWMDRKVQADLGGVGGRRMNMIKELSECLR